MTNEKTLWIDTWRGWLIILVVIGHVSGAICHYVPEPDRSVCCGIRFLIYAFHMQAFFFLSGYLWHGSAFREFFIRRTRRLIIPYIAVGLISMAVYLIVQHAQGLNAADYDGYYRAHTANSHGLATCLLSMIHAGNWPNGTGFCFNSVLWFLPCMFSVQVIYWGLSRLIKEVGCQLVLTMAIYVGLFFLNYYHQLPCLPWGLSPAQEYFFFFVLGVWTKEKRNLRFPSIPWCAVILMICGHVLATYVRVQNLNDRHIVYFISDFLSAVFGIYASAAVISRIRCNILVRLLSYLGINTMSIMLWHKFVITGAQFGHYNVLALGQKGHCIAILLGLVIIGIAITGPLLLSHFYKKAILGINSILKA